MRYFRFIYRRRTFTSLSEINCALVETIAKINAKLHSRFKVSREERFVNLEKVTLGALPLEAYSMSEWKTAILHPDCRIAVDSNFYTAPHVLRGKELRVKLTASRVEIFLDLQRVALHSRTRGKVGERVIDPMHLPENARAYREATSQMLLSQAKFSHPDLHLLIDELFKEDALANLRRAQGLVRKAFSTIQTHGRQVATPWITNAIAQMRRFNRIRVRAFEELIQAEMKKKIVCHEDRTIVRQPGNPMVRGHGTQRPVGIEQTVPEQTTLRLV